MRDAIFNGFVMMLAVAVGGCSGDPAHESAVAADGGAGGSPDGGGTGADAADGADGASAPPPRALAPGDVGLDAMKNFAHLPFLRDAARAYQASSVDPAGENNDFSNYLNFTGDEATMLDADGPGVIYRFWHTGNITSGVYRFYFDGEPTPRLTVERAALWGGTSAPFVPPLTLGETLSSGGYVTYLPIPFEKSLRITTSGQLLKDYYDISYTQYGNGAGVSSYTAQDAHSTQEDVRAVEAMWRAVGANPIAPDPEDRTTRGAVDIAPGAAALVAQLAGPAQIVDLRLRIPLERVTDDGRAFRGKSSFGLAIDPNNQGVRLARRLDFATGNQQAEVRVDGVRVGTWSTPGSDLLNRWRDASFTIPSSFTQGKSSIELTVAFGSSDSAWTEFGYWAYSQTANGEVWTDSLDVGNVRSETAHHYSVLDQRWSGTVDATYPQHSGLDAADLEHLHLQIAWDDDAFPAVDAPVSAFFGSGAWQVGAVTALPIGNARGEYYCFFPMPFSRSARVSLVNGADGGTVSGLAYSLVHRPLPASYPAFGTFHALYTPPGPALIGKDYTILETSGSGQYVGVNLQLPAIGAVLEGNERIYVDGARSPQIQGTGTEDYFNGGWYFSFGSFQTPISGAPLIGLGTFTAYRFHLSDAIPFLSGIRVAIQHSAADAVVDGPYGSVAYYYASAAPRLQLTDEVDVGDDAREAAHAYTATNAATRVSLTGKFCSDDPTMLTDTGRAFRDGATFTVTIDPRNNGVLLRRLYDDSEAHAAQVVVDGIPVGRWNAPETSPIFRFRESEIWIPKSITAGKSRLSIEIRPTLGTWNEYRYTVFSNRSEM
jgi:hypothetical protein